MRLAIFVVVCCVLCCVKFDVLGCMLIELSCGVMLIDVVSMLSFVLAVSCDVSSSSCLLLLLLRIIITSVMIVMMTNVIGKVVDRVMVMSLFK